MSDAERKWRNDWALYFRKRAEKSLTIGRRVVNQQHFNDVAAGELACALMLESDESVDALTDALIEVG